VSDCTCFLGHPPCSYCTSHGECEECGKKEIPNEDLQYIDGQYVCDECAMILKFMQLTIPEPTEEQKILFPEVNWSE
jgi:hypothetical protein